MPEDQPLIVVNYKLYPGATGQGAVDLTRKLEDAARDGPGRVIVCPQAADLYRVAQATDLEVFAQHVDPLKAGSGTGWTLPEAVKDAGATGSLVNHAEHRLQLADIEAAATRLGELGLERIVCTNNAPTTAAAAALGVEWVAVEPPELIGGDVSVTSADPGIVRDSVDAARKVDADVGVLCGAGVKTGEDLGKSLELGAKGVLLASGITKAKDPGAALKDLLSGLS